MWTDCQLTAINVMSATRLRRVSLERETQLSWLPTGSILLIFLFESLMSTLLLNCRAGVYTVDQVYKVLAGL